MAAVQHNPLQILPPPQLTLRDYFKLPQVTLGSVLHDQSVHGTAHTRIQRVKDQFSEAGKAEKQKEHALYKPINRILNMCTLASSNARLEINVQPQPPLWTMIPKDATYGQDENAIQVPRRSDRLAAIPTTSLSERVLEHNAWTVPTAGTAGRSSEAPGASGTPGTQGATGVQAAPSQPTPGPPVSTMTVSSVQSEPDSIESTRFPDFCTDARLYDDNGKQVPLKFLHTLWEVKQYDDVRVALESNHHNDLPVPVAQAVKDVLMKDVPQILEQAAFAFSMYTEEELKTLHYFYAPCDVFVNFRFRRGNSPPTDRRKWPSKLGNRELIMRYADGYDVKICKYVAQEDTTLDEDQPELVSLTPEFCAAWNAAGETLIATLESYLPALDLTVNVPSTESPLTTVPDSDEEHAV